MAQHKKGFFPPAQVHRGISPPIENQVAAVMGMSGHGTIQSRSNMHSGTRFAGESLFAEFQPPDPFA